MMNIAKGEYIAIMESDDVSCNGRFKILVNFLESNKDVALV